MTQDAPRLARLVPAVAAYLGETAPLILFRADEDGEGSYQFQMAILEMDLEEA